MSFIRNCQIIVFTLFAIQLYWQQCSAQNRIVGGVKTTINKFPFMVFIRKNNQLECGGALIAPQFVLTAGHCVYRASVRTLTVVGGTSNANGSGGIVRKATKAMLPRSYNYNSRNMDIAVIKLAAPMNGIGIRTIPLCSSRLLLGKSITVAGWGRTSEDSNLPGQLRKVQVPLLSKQRCERQYRGVETLTKSMFCAYLRGKDSCSGDSGGPAVYNGEVCGVVSWGYGCGRFGYSGVYTSVNYAKKFINRALRS